MRSNGLVQPQPVSLKSIHPSSPIVSEEKVLGGVIAFAVIGIWAVSTLILLLIEPSKFNLLGIVGAIWWQTFLYTGLFITAHDAMHGVVFPGNPKLNHWMGTLAVTLYGLFSYKELLRKHWLHHNHPASELDPDFHDGRHENIFAWYFHFMKGYWNWVQIAALALIFNLIHYYLNVPEFNLTLFWVVPSLLSSVQLFFFGTYLTHKEPKGGYKSSSRAITNPLPVVWSFLTCYHFGYHEEHHEYPRVPWWKLPTIYKMQRS